MLRWLKKAARGPYWWFRHATSDSRALPDSLIIGAQKSGTTSLWNFLTQHPQLLPARKKEVHYFDGGLDPAVDHYALGERWYRMHFPFVSSLRPSSKTFEASPLYMFNPEVPKRIHDLVPDASLIAILRNPTERAISHYQHSVRYGFESQPIMEALESEESRIRLALDRGDYKDLAFMHQSYKTRGLYAEQLRRFREYFPEDRILILSTEDLRRDPASTLASTFDFLEVESDVRIDDLAHLNVAPQRSDVGAEVYVYLDDFFRAPNEALFDLIGRRFDWERTAEPSKVP